MRGASAGGSQVLQYAVGLADEHTLHACSKSTFLLLKIICCHLHPGPRIEEVEEGVGAD